MTNITKYAVGHRSITWFFLVVMLLGGIYAFDALGKKEDSTFVIKSAIVSFMAQKMTVEFEDGADEKSVMTEVLKACKKVERDFQIEL